jgi:hypothetical protein
MKDLALKIASGCISRHDLDSADPSAVFEAKTQSAIPQTRSVARAPKATEKPRTKSYVFSDERVDRMGDVILVSGWDLANYKQNPVILWGHNAGAPPIGLGSRVRSARVEDGRALVGDVTFVEEDVNPHAETIWRLADAGVLRTVSVGFQPIEASWGDDITEKERKKYGVSKYGVLYRRSELLETSIVSIPANPGAVELGLKDLVSKGLLTDGQASAWLKEYPTSEEAALERARAAVRSVVDMGRSSTEEDTAAATDSPDGASEEQPTEDTEPTVPSATSTPPVEDNEETEEAEERSVRDSVAFAAALERQTLALAGVLEQHAESIAAMRQLTDVVTDLARKAVDSPARMAPEEPSAEGTDDLDGEDPERVADLLKRAAETISRLRS